MGCGKSSVGRRLSDLLCCPFMDLDAVIEQQTGRSIPEIFATDGEAAFRQMELAALQNIVHTAILSPTLILSLGGGTVMTPECAALIHEHTVCVYLRTSVDILVARLANEPSARPLLAANNVIPSEVEESILRHRIEALMSRRSHIYESTAHHMIDTDGCTIDSVAELIIKILNGYGMPEIDRQL